MKLKFANVTDEYTLMPFLFLQVEETDREFFKDTGIEPGYKIAIQFVGTKVAAAGGYKFIPEQAGSSIIDRSLKIGENGTVNALGLLLNVVDDIKALPKKIDVNYLRHRWLELTQKYASIRTRLIENDEYLKEINCKKVLYKSKCGKTVIMAIIDNTYKKIWSFYPADYGDYLWLPIDEINDDEWAKFVSDSENRDIERVINY